MFSHRAYCAENNQFILYDVLNIAGFFACNPDAPFQLTALDRAKGQNPSPEVRDAYNDEKNSKYDHKVQLKVESVYLEASEKKNDSFAQARLGQMYSRGELFPQNGIDRKQEALKFLRKSAASNNSYSLFALGSLFLEQADMHAEAKKSLQRASALEHPVAMLTLGLCYKFGKNSQNIIAQNDRVAEQLFKKILGLPNEPQNNLAQGCLYLFGLGIRQDKLKGLTLLARAEKAEAWSNNLYTMMMPKFSQLSREYRGQDKEPFSFQYDRTKFEEIKTKYERDDTGTLVSISPENKEIVIDDPRHNKRFLIEYSADRPLNNDYIEKLSYNTVNSF